MPCLENGILQPLHIEHSHKDYTSTLPEAKSPPSKSGIYQPRDAGGLEGCSLHKTSARVDPPSSDPGRATRLRDLLSPE